ncbi:sperm acrosome membrane-associated protein 4-like [Eucyclogobius newberryi]|uniref:sperm acrosome membrane-associated protein 4-like n=1 Tax=Eucyclogobius newberryi TaxID=166745 RepID=UPI003B59B465
MNRLVLLLWAVTFCFAADTGLRCYECTLGLGSLCLTTETTCKVGEQCFSGKGKAAGVTVTMKGCLAVAECNKTTDVNFPSSGNTTIYKMTKTCCDSNLCNSAPAGLPGALQLALLSLTAVFAANALV